LNHHASHTIKTNIKTSVRSDHSEWGLTWSHLHSSFANVYLMNANAVKAQINAILVRFVAVVTLEWFHAGVCQHVTLEVVRLCVR